MSGSPPIVNNQLRNPTIISNVNGGIVSGRSGGSEYLATQIGPPPIIVKGQPGSIFIIIIATLILFLIFWAWIFWKVNANTTQFASVGGQLLLSCQQGECGTNMTTGSKRCPENTTEVILIDPSSEVCNPAFSCTNPLTPFALLADGSTNSIGVCNPGVTCRCLNVAQCATHVTTVFSTVNGSFYDQSADNRFTFAQVPLQDDVGATNATFTNGGTAFCGIKSNELNRLSPGACTFTDFDFVSAQGTLKIATDCINTNPCVIGTMAFNTTTPATLETNGVGTNEVLNIPVTCVIGTPASDTSGTLYPDGKCPLGYVPYWDNRWALLRCAVINYTTIP